MPRRYVGPLAAAVLAAALVVCAVVVVLVRGDEPSAPSVPTPPVSPARETSSAPPPEPEPSEPTGEPSTEAGGKLFSCPRRGEGDDPPADLVEQAAVVEHTGGLVTDAYSVHRAAATPLGPVALVEGDLDAARAELVGRGVAIIEAWDATDESGLPFLQVDRAVDQHLRRAMGAIVRGLRPMSSVHVTRTSPCADDSGVVVGMAPDTLFPGRRAHLQEMLSAVAGVPVFVVPQEPRRR